MQNQIPKNWQEYKLEEVIGKFIDYRGKTPKKDSSGIPLVTAKIIKNGIIQEPNEFISQDTYKKWMTRGFPESGDILLTTEAPLGEVATIKDKNIALAQRVILLRCNSKFLTNPFLKYWLKSSIGQNRIKSRSSGSTVTGIRSSELKKVLISVPSLSQQEHVTGILSAFDDKIGVNNKISKTLEEMAQTLFKEWFIKNESEAWEVKKLGQILTLKHGFAFKSEQFTANKTKNVVVRMGNFQETGGLQFSDNTFYLDSANGYEKYILNPGDMVMIFSDITREGRLIGNVGLIPNDEDIYFLNQRVAKIDYNQIYKYFLLCLFNSKLFHQHCLARADSATVLNLKNEHITEYQLADPGKDILDKFNKVASPIFKKLESIKKENLKLAALRDLFLPKLMKGEIRI